MPVFGNLYRFDEEGIAKAPKGKGVYSLHNADETIYIGKAEGGGGIKGRLLYHLHGRDNCTKQATGYRYEYNGDPITKERELLIEYRLAHGRFPLCNERFG